MKKYNSYAEAKIANPKSDIAVNNRGDIFIPVENLSFSDGFNFKARGAADYCMTVERFFVDGHKFVEGDVWSGEGGVYIVGVEFSLEASNQRYGNDHKKFILRAAALENQMNIDKIEIQKEKTNTSEVPNSSECDAPHYLHSDEIFDNGQEIEYINEDDEWSEFKGRYVCFDLHAKSHVFVAANNEIYHAGFGQIRKPETPQQRNDRERLEAAYDLFCVCTESDGATPCSFDVFVNGTIGNSKKRFLAIVDKTNYRKGA